MDKPGEESQVRRSKPWVWWMSQSDHYFFLKTMLHPADEAHWRRVCETLPNERSCNFKFSACWTAGPELIPLEPSFGIATCSHVAIMPIDKEQTDISSWSYCLHRIGGVKCFQIATKQHGQGTRGKTSYSHRPQPHISNLSFSCWFPFVIITRKSTWSCLSAIDALFLG